MYNYLKAMKEDVLEYINNEINLSDYEDLDELEQFLNDELWTVDSVTGNFWAIPLTVIRLKSMYATI